MDIVFDILNEFSFKSIVDIISWIIMIYGLFLMFTSSLGMIRMPDLYTKIHALSISDSIGIPLILVGVSIKLGLSFQSLKTLLLMLIMFFISPLSSYCLSQSCLYKGIMPIGNRK